MSDDVVERADVLFETVAWEEVSRDDWPCVMRELVEEVRQLRKADRIATLTGSIIGDLYYDIRSRVQAQERKGELPDATEDGFDADDWYDKHRR